MIEISHLILEHITEDITEINTLFYCIQGAGGVMSTAGINMEGGHVFLASEELPPHY